MCFFMVAVAPKKACSVVQMKGLTSAELPRALLVPEAIDAALIDNLHTGKANIGAYASGRKYISGKNGWLTKFIAPSIEIMDPAPSPKEAMRLP
jgi:hypothetical protein